MLVGTCSYVNIQIVNVVEIVQLTAVLLFGVAVATQVTLILLRSGAVAFHFRLIKSILKLLPALLLLLLPVLPLLGSQAIVEVALVLGGLFALLVFQSARHHHVELLDVLCLLVEHFGRRKLACFVDLFELVISKPNHYVFGFEIGVDNLTHSMHEVKPDQALSCEFSHEWNGYTFVIVSFNDF